MLVIKLGSGSLVDAPLGLSRYRLSTALFTNIPTASGTDMKNSLLCRAAWEVLLASHLVCSEQLI